MENLCFRKELGTLLFVALGKILKLFIGYKTFGCYE